jgi:hypothetical protein
MSTNPVASSIPLATHVPAVTRASARSQAAPAAPAPQAQAARPAVQAVPAAVLEATESPAQTLKEASSGDRQAQKLLHHSPQLGRVINTKA